MAEQKTRNEPGGLRSYRHFPYPHPGMPMAHTHNDIEINYVAEGDITYRFGNSQVKAARQRKSAIEDEKKRAESGGQGGIGQ